MIRRDRLAGAARASAFAALALSTASLGAACAAPGARAQAATPARASHGSPVRLYVPNQDDATVTIVDAWSGAPLATVDLRAHGLSPNAKPHHALAEPDGSAWYVSLSGEGQILKFDRGNRLVGRVTTPAPGMLALDHRRGRLYASRSMTAVSAPSSIAVVRTGPGEFALEEDLDVLVPRPHAIVVDTVSGRTYTAGLGDNRIAVVDERGQVRVVDVPGPNHVYVTFALSPDGRRLAASTQLTSKLLAFDASEPVRLRPLASVDVLPWGYQIAWAPDGKSVWLGNQRSDAATQVDAERWTVAGVVRHAGFAEPHGVALTPDGATVFVSSHGRADTTHVAGTPVAPADTAHGGMHAERGARGSGTVVEIDARTRAVRRVVPVGRYAAGIGVGGRP
ncbi:MAG TPA: hypothetical protein VNK43_02290 [Gemmatimonadales bacterium]|nr:hypothetical protein [Gemmatimonadales bacterium]